MSRSGNDACLSACFGPVHKGACKRRLSYLFWLVDFVVQTSIELIYDLPRFVLACAQQGLITARARSSSILLPWCLMTGRGKLFKVCYGRTLASNWLADRSQLRQLRCLLGLEVPHLQECSICSFIVHRKVLVRSDSMTRACNRSLKMRGYCLLTFCFRLFFCLFWSGGGVGVSFLYHSGRARKTCSHCRSQVVLMREGLLADVH